jgi:hypothetical protein
MECATRIKGTKSDVNATVIVWCFGAVSLYLAAILYFEINFRRVQSKKVRDTVRSLCKQTASNRKSFNLFLHSVSQIIISEWGAFDGRASQNVISDEVDILDISYQYLNSSICSFCVCADGF